MESGDQRGISESGPLRPGSEFPHADLDLETQTDDFSFGDDDEEGNKESPDADRSPTTSSSGAKWLAVVAGLFGLWMVVAFISSFTSSETPIAVPDVGPTATATPLPTPAPAVLAEPDPNATPFPTEIPTPEAPAEIDSVGLDPSGLPPRSVNETRLRLLRSPTVAQLQRRGIAATVAYPTYEGLVVIDLASGLANIIPIGNDPRALVPSMQIVNFDGSLIGIHPATFTATRVPTGGWAPLSASDDSLFFVSSVREQAPSAFVFQALGSGSHAAQYEIQQGKITAFEDQGYVVTAFPPDSTVRITARDGWEILTVGETLLDVKTDAFLVRSCDGETGACPLLIRDRPNVGQDPLVVGEVESDASDRWVLSPTGTAFIQIREDGSATLFEGEQEWSTTLFDRGVAAPRWSPDGQLVAWLDVEGRLSPNGGVDGEVPVFDSLRIMVPEQREWLELDLEAAGLPLPDGPTIAIW